jgi:hypothetical protein
MDTEISFNKVFFREKERLVAGCFVCFDEFLDEFRREGRER